MTIEFYPSGDNTTNYQDVCVYPDKNTEVTISVCKSDDKEVSFRIECIDNHAMATFTKDEFLALIEYAKGMLS